MMSVMLFWNEMSKNNHNFLLWLNTKDEEGTIHCLTVVRMSDTDLQRTVLLCFSIKSVLKCSVFSLVKAWVWRTRPWLWGSPNVSSSCSKAVVLNSFLASAHVNARHVSEDQTRVQMSRRWTGQSHNRRAKTWPLNWSGLDLALLETMGTISIIKWNSVSSVQRTSYWWWKCKL